MKRAIKWAALTLAVAAAGCVNVPKTTVTGSIQGQPFTLSCPKDCNLQKLEIKADKDNAVSIKIDSLQTKMNPDVITTTAAGQAQMISAITDAVIKSIAAGAAAAK
jgi:hypothetical protein